MNRELKKLLVASVGDDLQYHFERMAREKNQLILENEVLGRNMSQLSEQLERMSIQCDVWRSKFLASRYALLQNCYNSVLLQSFIMYTHCNVWQRAYIRRGQPQQLYGHL